MIMRDVLDNQVIDRNMRNLGKVDGVIAIERKGKPPRIAYIEIGATTMAARLSKRLAKWMRACLMKFGPKNFEPCRIPFSKVTEIGVNINVDVDGDAENIGALAWEHWLRDEVIDRIPGAS